MEANRLKLKQVGYQVLTNVISAEIRNTLTNKLPNISNSGSRKLLSEPIFADTVNYIRQHSLLSEVLSQLVAIQCTFFRKSQEHNWSISLHRDLFLPLQGEGKWHFSGIKEGLNFVRPPREFLDRCVIVRLNLDDAFEGDLSIVPYSHLDTAKHTITQAKSIRVPRCGALILYPSTVHGSTKLKRAEHRRVLHYLFAPSQLPFNYQYYYVI